MGRITKAKTHVFANDDLQQVLHTADNGPGFTKTKLIITLGPASRDVDVLCELLEAGTTCARVDLTWAPIDYHRVSLQNLQEAMRRTRRLCAVMLDCLGRDMMVRREYGVDENGWPGIFQRLTISAGQTVVITNDPAAKCSSEVLPVTYDKFPSMVQPGDSIFVGRYLVTGADDSSLFLEVREVSGHEVFCEAKNNAVLDGLLTVFHQERSPDGLSNVQNDLPALTEFDKHAIGTLCSEFEVDFVTLSYCRSPEDIHEAKDFLESIGRDGIKVVAKCETRQALFNFKPIVTAADAIIISRGNLGLDVAPEKMAMCQKAMISACSSLGKPSIITRVVDTMIKTPRPTRAEATDIANAVLDGVDGIMLGAETYRGQYALETARTVIAICREAEAVFDHHNHFEHLLNESMAWDAAAAAADKTATDDEDPELPRSRSGAGLHRQISQVSLMSDHASGNGLLPSSANLRRVPSGPLTMHSKLESIASAAVKAADKVGAALIICITHTGRTANMIAKYRPPMPIMTLVVPYLKNEDGLRWTLEGRSTARQALLTSGLLPVLAAPTPSAGESLLEEAVVLASANGLVGPHDHVVVVSRSSSHEFQVKIVSVSEGGAGIKKIRPKSLLDLVKAAGQYVVDEEDWEDGGGATDGGAPLRAAAAAAAGKRSLERRSSVIVGSRADALVPFETTSTLPTVEEGAAHSTTTAPSPAGPQAYGSTANGTAAGGTANGTKSH